MALATAGFVSTPEVEGIDEISLNESPYRLHADTGPGGVTKDNTTVVSPYVHGETLVGSRRDLIVMPLTLLVSGDDPDELQVNTAVVLRAFDQWRYRVGLTIDGVEWEWYCQPASYVVGDAGKFDRILLMHRPCLQVYAVSVPRDPIPIQGAF